MSHAGFGMSGAAGRASEKDPHSLLRTIAEGTEPLLQKIPTPSVSHFQFLVDGVPYYARHNAEQGQRLEIWAVLGYMPYTAESPQRRKMLITILDSARHLQHVKIGVNREHQIIVMMYCRTAEVRSPTFLFHPLAFFLQEAGPYIRLIGEYL